MAKRRYINIEHDERKRKTCNRNKKGAKEKENSSVQRITAEKEELLKHPLYEDYTFQKLELSLIIVCFILLKQHNYLLISSKDEIMLTNLTNFESITKIKFPTEDIHHIIELANGKIITASDKKIYLNEDEENDEEDAQSNDNEYNKIDLLLPISNNRFITLSCGTISIYDGDGDIETTFETISIYPYG